MRKLLVVLVVLALVAVAFALGGGARLVRKWNPLGTVWSVHAEAVSPDGTWVARIENEAKMLSRGRDVVTLTGPGGRHELYSGWPLRGELRWSGPRELVFDCREAEDGAVYESGWEDVRFTVDYACRPILLRLPPGFLGPAVVLYGVEGGVPAGNRREMAFAVPATGVLAVADPLPDDVCGLHFRRSPRAGEPARELRSSERAPADEVQVTAFAHGEAGGVAYQALLVGRRGEDPDADATLARAVAEALGALGH